MEREWPLILFTLFVCASSGTLLMQGVLTLRGKGKKMQLGSLLTSLILLVIGGIAVFMHLQHWERMFNGFGHITSGITQEVIGNRHRAVLHVHAPLRERHGAEVDFNRIGNRADIHGVHHGAQLQHAGARLVGHVHARGLLPREHGAHGFAHIVGGGLCVEELRR